MKPKFSRPALLAGLEEKIKALFCVFHCRICSAHKPHGLFLYNYLFYGMQLTQAMIKIKISVMVLIGCAKAGK